MQHSTLYTLLFAAAVCVVAGVLVSTSAVTLADRQIMNAEVEKQKNVLLAAGLIKADDKVTHTEIHERFQAVEPVVVDLETDEPVEDVDVSTYDQHAALKDPTLSEPAPPNNAGIKRLPNRALVYQVRDDSGEVQMLVLPIEGLGLWGTLFGFLALDADTTTIRGLAYYQHKETPGLGGEVDNPNWRALWTGRHAYDESWEPKVEVIKGAAGPPAEDPYRVDGLSGATITSRSVTHMIHFWLGEHGFGPYLENLRERRRES